VGWTLEPYFGLTTLTATLRKRGLKPEPPEQTTTKIEIIDENITEPDEDDD
jgi:hypothetical protein